MVVKTVALLGLVAVLAACGQSAASEPQPRAVAVPVLPSGPNLPAHATLPVEEGQSVVLHHCGVVNIAYGGQEWEVEDDPFDMSTAPDTFSGFGSFSREHDVLTFKDDKGATLTFTPWDGTADPYICM